MLQLTVDSLESLQESQRVFYDKEKGEDGKFHLKKEVAELVKKSQANSEFSKIVEQQNSQIQKLTETVDKLGKTTEVNSILKDVINNSKEPKEPTKEPTKDNNPPEENPELVVLRKQNNDLVEQLKVKEQQEQQALLEKTVKNSITKHNGVFDLLFPLIKDKIALKDGEVVVVNEAGQVKFSDKTAKQMTLDELIDGYKTHPTYKTCFKDSSVPGANIEPASNHSTDIYNKNPKHMTKDEKIKVMTDKGGEYWTELLKRHADTNQNPPQQTTPPANK